MKQILVTGGAGYIGSHTIVDLQTRGYEVISIDNFSNSFPEALKGIESITGIKVHNYNIDLCDAVATETVFRANPNIAGVIHFAAYKYVNESVKFPNKYYKNNINSLISLLDCCEKFNVEHFVFSSSCSVYGNAQEQPVSEETPKGTPESPYANTKLVCEQIIENFSLNYPLKTTLLRYFNPIGAHPSGLIGETPKSAPQNIIPILTTVAKGLIASFTIAGDIYPTRDGTCIRDYIHVCDIASAHILALEELFKSKEPIAEVYNLGSGKGTTVLEIVKAFETANSLSLNCRVGAPRLGDVAAIYADATKAKEKLLWQPKFTLEQMMRSAWLWDKNE